MKKLLLAPVVLTFASIAHAADTPLSAALRDFANGQIERKQVAGLLAEVGDKDQVLSRQTAGFADIATGKKIAADDLFWIASMSKPVTGTAVMMAVEKGLLKVSDPVSTYLPEFKKLLGPDGKPASITIAQCLSHTSGLQDLSPEESHTTTTLAELTAITAAKPLNFMPGTQWAYCQTGINTAARVLEVVSGQSFPGFLSEKLFTPLGMTDTTFYPTAAQAERLVTPYETTPDGLNPVALFIGFGKSLDDKSRCPSGAGGLFSTAADYGKFARMILNGGQLNGKRFLTEASVKEMTSSHTGALQAGFVPGSAYGLGWICVAEPSGVTAPLSPGSFGHGGMYGTQAWIDPAKNRYTLLLVQRSNFGIGDASETRSLFQEAASK